MAGLLILGGKITLPAQEAINPSEFFRTRQGLRVEEPFRDRIVSVAEPVAVPETVIASFELARPADDTQIRAALPEGHVFEASAFCAHLAGLLSRQAEGEKGDLPVDGTWTVVYVHGRGDEDFAVDFCWSTEWLLVSSRVVFADCPRWGQDDLFLSATA